MQPGVWIRGATPAARLVRRAGVALLVLLAITGSLIGATASPVHAVRAVSSSPADGEVLPIAPTQVSVTFDGPVGSAFQMLLSCNGTVPQYTAARISDDSTSLIIDASLTPLPKGECDVVWVVQGVTETGTDRGSFSFTIQQDTVAAATTLVADATATTAPGTPDAAVSSDNNGVTTTSTTSLRGPQGLFRMLSTIAIAALFGALVLIVTAWPEGVEYILTIRFTRYAWVVAVITTWVLTACVVADLRGKGFSSSLVPTTWTDLKDSTPGIALLARVLLVIFCGWVAMRPERVIDPATQLPALVIPGLAVATLGFSRSGGELEIAGYAAGVVHALAMAVWFGGLVLLARVVLAGPGEDDLVHAVRGFGRISTPAMLLTVLSGAVQLYRLDRGHLFDSPHGRWLLVKVIFVIGMVFVGVATRQFVRARLSRAESLSAPMAGRLRRAIGMEALIGVVVLLLTATLVATQPRNLADAGTSAEFAYHIDLQDATSTLDATIYVTPTRVGPNAVLVEIDKPTTGISNFTVRFDPPPDAPVSPVVITVTQFPVGVTGWYLPLDQGIPLGAPGRWTITLDVVSIAGTFHEGGGLDIISTETRDDVIPEVTSPPVTSPTTTTAVPESTTTIPA